MLEGVSAALSTPRYVNFNISHEIATSKPVERQAPTRKPLNGWAWRGSIINLLKLLRTAGCMLVQDACAIVARIELQLGLLERR